MDLFTLFIISLPLLIWIGITLLVMKLFGRIALDITKKEWGRKLGKFIGFMLVMGQFLISWTYEYYRLKSEINLLCKASGGLEVYITPEEWRKQIGEKEWSTLYPEDKSGFKEFNFDGKVFQIFYQVNRRIEKYDNIQKNNGITWKDYIYVDNQTNQVLMRKRYFYLATQDLAQVLPGLPLKFWLRNIEGKDCYKSVDGYEYDYEYSKQYSNQEVKKGN